MTQAQKEIHLLIDLLRIEKDKDYALYQRKMLNTSVDERRKKGVTWYPVSLQNYWLSTGERFTIELDRASHQEYNHAFQVGSVVGFFSGLAGDSKSVQAVVNFVRKDKMRIVLNENELPPFLRDGKLGVNLLFDEGSYKEMFSALKEVSKAKTGRLAELREIFYGNHPFQFKKNYDYTSVHLNPKQNEALTKVFNAQDIGVIHGPPGTW